MELEWQTHGLDWTATVDHGMKDEYGRQVGGQAYVWQFPTDWHFEPARGLFDLTIEPLRNGKHYGATHRGTTYPTLEAAMAAAPAKLEAQRKAYQRKYRAPETAAAALAEEHAGQVPSAEAETRRYQAEQHAAVRDASEPAPWVREAAGPLGMIERNPQNPAEYRYLPTSDPNVLERRQAVALYEEKQVHKTQADLDAATPRHTATHRTCYRCQKLGRPAVHPVAEFTRRASGTYFSACKTCNREMQRERRAKEVKN